jgi:hypothetical protein
VVGGLYTCAAAAILSGAVVLTSAVFASLPGADVSVTFSASDSLFQGSLYIIL